MHAYIRAYVPTHIHTYICMCLHVGRSTPHAKNNVSLGTRYATEGWWKAHERAAKRFTKGLVVLRSWFWLSVGFGYGLVVNSCFDDARERSVRG